MASTLSPRVLRAAGALQGRGAASLRLGAWPSSGAVFLVVSMVCVAVDVLLLKILKLFNYNYLARDTGIYSALLVGL